GQVVPEESAKAPEGAEGANQATPSVRSDSKDIAVDKLSLNEVVRELTRLDTLSETRELTEDELLRGGALEAKLREAEPVDEPLVATAEEYSVGVKEAIMQLVRTNASVRRVLKLNRIDIKDC
ncbi:MAG: hypothetical protein DRI61_04840, partial [Chloroflexi bacterium]